MAALLAQCVCAVRSQTVTVINEIMATAAYTTASANVMAIEGAEGTVQAAIAAEQTALSQEFRKIAEWESKYNDYLKTAAGFAEMVEAGTKVYTESLRMFFNLFDMKKVVESNPEGAFSTALLNDLYLEVATQIVSVYTLLKSSVAKGGQENMLTGSERLELAWQLDDALVTLNHSLRKLILSVSYTNMLDVWNTATAGIVYETNGSIARKALERWGRRASAGLLPD